MAQNLIASGISWEQIIYITFEDERLSEFTLDDFDRIPPRSKRIVFTTRFLFFDEIQNVKGWEKFARRMADAKQRVQITGSNATMLSKDMEKVLGGRYFSKYISTYHFNEYLNAKAVSHAEEDFHKKKSVALMQEEMDAYLTYGGFPESLFYQDKREYVSNVFQKVLLGDIATRNNIRNTNVLRVLIKKIAESCTSPVSYTKLHHVISSIGMKISKDTIIDYIQYMKGACLICL